MLPRPADVRGYLDYLRDLGLYDLYTQGQPSQEASIIAWTASLGGTAATPERSRPGVDAGRVASSITGEPVRPQRPPQPPPAAARPVSPPPRAREAFEIRIAPQAASPVAPSPSPQPSAEMPPQEFDGLQEAGLPSALAPPSMPLISFNQIAPLPATRLTSAEKPAALANLRATIGDCTRCPLAYAGRHTIVFADGNPDAELMFVGEGPGADEDASGVPFVGKAGQLLNNMIAAMGIRRESVYIANIVKCRPPKNRVPEPVEANTCSPFLAEQIDIVQPKVIVALGSTAATYLLGVRQSLAALRGHWHQVRGAKCAVTFHPAFLLRDPRQKGEAWKDLQRVMVELNLKPPARSAGGA